MTQLVLTKDTAGKRKLVRELVKQYDDGRIFAVVNVKADGNLRHYKAMTNVQAGLKGCESTTAHKPYILTIFDTDVNEYRAVNLDTVLFLKFGEREFIFLDTATVDKIRDVSVRNSLTTAALSAHIAQSVVTKAIKV